MLVLNPSANLFSVQPGRSGELSLFLKLFIMVTVTILFVGAAVGCGGGEQEQESATGVVKSFEQEDRRLRLKPQGEDALVFKYNPENIEVTLGGEEAKPEDIEEGQRATVSYVVKDDRQLARSIELEKKK